MSQVVLQGTPSLHRSVFPYYGGKTNQLKDIYNIMREHINSFDVVVDVFGGSGKVLLNLPDDWRKVKVYNDINKELYVTFRVLQDPNKNALLLAKLNTAFAHADIFNELKNSTPETDIDIAFKVIYLQTYSYMGDGKTFGRVYKGYKTRKLDIGDWVYTKDWIIEDEDFRSLMDRYRKPRVFFYLDPPYLSSGKKYDHTFSLEDFRALRDKMDNHEGSYLLNLSSYDEEMIDIFGQPNKTIEYANPLKDHGTVKWTCGYWYKFPDNTTTPPRRYPTLDDFSEKYI
ncbi:MAG: DNA adenine methylase [Candidatus Parvarchaeota archaeon]